MEPVTKERLSRYISLKQENENRLERLARMKSAAEMPAQRDSDGAKHTGSSGERMARAIEAYLEYKEQIGPLVEANRREMAEIEAAVAALPDPLEREVLRLRYMDGEHCRMLSWREVAWKIYGESNDAAVSRLKRLHKAAVKEIEQIKKRRNFANKSSSGKTISLPDLLENGMPSDRTSAHRCGGR